MENAEPSLVEAMEEEKQDDKKKEIIAELLKQVPYSLSVALIKVSQLNNYAPLPLEKYYSNILPTFEYLRRTDGSKYKTHTMTTVRSAMVSNKLYTRNNDNLYEINLSNVITHLKMIKQKKAVNEGDIEGSTADNFEDASQEEPNINSMNSITNVSNESPVKSAKSTKKKKEPKEPKEPKELRDINSEFIGRKRKYFRKAKREGVKTKIDKYVRTYDLLKKLLKIAYQDKVLYSQLNLDFSNITETNLDDRKISIDKIIGMLTVFKFFKAFLEKCFNAIRVQDSLRDKICELNSEANYLEAIFRSEE
jgi:hypothetical protein